MRDVAEQLNYVTGYLLNLDPNTRESTSVDVSAYSYKLCGSRGARTLINRFASFKSAINMTAVRSRCGPDCLRFVTWGCYIKYFLDLGNQDR